MNDEWIKMRASLCTHPRVLRIAAIIGADPAVSRRLTTGFNGALDEVVTRDVTRDVTLASLLRVWCAANDHTVDGVWVNGTLEMLDQIAGVPGFGAAMQAAGWAEVDADRGRLTFPNFLENNAPSKNGNRSSAAERQRRYRERKQVKGDVTRDVLSDVTRDDRTEQSRGTSVPPISPSPTGEKQEVQRELGILALVPNGGWTSGRRRRRASFTTGETAIAREVLDYLNSVSKHRFQPVPCNVGFIVDRLAEGYTPLVLKLLAYHQLTQWRNDPKMIKYLRPETLYNETKCAQYAGQVPGAYFKTCAECSAEILPDMHGCPSGCEAKAEAARVKVPMPEHVRRRDGESVREWMQRLKPAAAAA